ncbi:hypothetical protein CC78DRAFT_546064 [Lojkania enalia]|uniref:Uncharacterized protein n=1 Tax=Lojkania enalia TaxID=147567 RepID=A0A9P4K4X4_9PLEO|nr:hypothetical protein CC78DRAFT_546064 [Didymosphaeria enalia]
MASSIPELQSAFGQILLLEKSKNPSHSSNPKWIGTSVPFQYPPPYVRPKWTGSFRLFDFPRELRDRIYFYIVFNPKTLVWKRNSPSPHDSFHFKPVDSDYLNLFLTCRQVHEEALKVFCRFNIFGIQFKKFLAGSLRVFPARQAGMVQRVQLYYRQYDWRYDWRRHDSTGAFAQMMLEAMIAKEFFPVLRECVAFWDVWNQEWLYGLSSGSVDETMQAFLVWMRGCYELDKLVPPAWLRVEFRRRWRPEEMWALQTGFNRALDVFRREAKDQADQDMEDSGQKWLLEAWSEGNKKSRRRLEER